MFYTRNLYHVFPVRAIQKKEYAHYIRHILTIYGRPKSIPGTWTTYFPMRSYRRIYIYIEYIYIYIHTRGPLNLNPIDPRP